MATAKRKSANRSPESNLVRAGYLATEATLTALARRYAEGVDVAEETRGTYLRVLVAHSKRELEAQGSRRVTVEIALAAVQAAHDVLYPIVLKAITTADIAPDEDADAEETRRRTRERNRRSTFARTSKTTLVRAIEGGARLAAMDPKTITKEELMTRFGKVRAGPGTHLERIGRLSTTLESEVRELAQADPDAAAKAVQELQKALRAVLKQPGEPEQPPMEAQPPRPLIRGRKKVGELTLTAH